MNKAILSGLASLFDYNGSSFLFFETKILLQALYFQIINNTKHVFTTIVLRLHGFK
jgi:hypothetical protein